MQVQAAGVGAVLVLAQQPVLIERGAQLAGVAFQLLRIGGAAGFERMTCEEQCQISTRDTRVVLWLITSGQARATPEYLARSNVHIGQIAAWVHRKFHQRFLATAAELGFDRVARNLQWWAVAKVAAVVGIPPERLTRKTFDEGHNSLLAAVGKLFPGQPSPPRNLNTRLHGAEATLFHAGVIDGPPRKRKENQAELRAQQWVSVPPRLAVSQVEHVRPAAPMSWMPATAPLASNSRQASSSSFSLNGSPTWTAGRSSFDSSVRSREAKAAPARPSRPVSAPT